MTIVSMPGASPGIDIAPPDWTSIYSDPMDCLTAEKHWEGIVFELRRMQALTAENAHSVERLVHHRMVYASASRRLAEVGAVSKPRRGNPKAIERVSPWWTVMREAAADIDRMEAELGLSPRRRGGVATVSPPRGAKKARDEFRQGH